ncbi:MAG: Holliday junction branch migration protein RuvA [Clostridia bacterium]|nr:Holliday junction branch migration protein RuvA [Clostridia bacterium]
MIGYLKGKVLDAEDGVVILLNNGIGYEVSCSTTIYNKLVANGEGEVYTYMAVKEDGISLYGFSDLQEKKMFLKLISVSGIGPKMGITILSNMDITSLVLAIATSNVKALSSIKGLGKKTAERIILELKENVGSVDTSSGEITVTTKETEVNNDAVIALMSLGFTKSECVVALKKAEQNGAKTMEELIKFSIKNMGKI